MIVFVFEIRYSSWNETYLRFLPYQQWLMALPPDNLTDSTYSTALFSSAVWLCIDDAPRTPSMHRYSISSNTSHLAVEDQLITFVIPISCMASWFRDAPVHEMKCDESSSDTGDEYYQRWIKIDAT